MEENNHITMVAHFRPKVRILKPPGGSTHDIFGTSETPRGPPLLLLDCDDDEGKSSTSKSESKDLPFRESKDLTFHESKDLPFCESKDLTFYENKEPICYCESKKPLCYCESKEPIYYCETIADLMDGTNVPERASKSKKNESEGLRVILQPDLNRSGNPEAQAALDAKSCPRNESINVSETFNYNSTAVWHPYLSYAEDHRKLTGCRSQFETMTEESLKKKQEQRLAMTPHHHWNSYVFRPDMEPEKHEPVVQINSHLSKKGQAFLLGGEIACSVEKNHKKPPSA